MVGESPMIAKLWFLLPEIILFVAAVTVSVMGLSPNRRLRDAVPVVVCLALGVAMVATPVIYGGERVDETLLMPWLGLYVKMLVCGVGIFLTLLSIKLIDRRMEEAITMGQTKFDPLRVNRGEFFAFMLLSLIGIMLCSTANDLIWLFLALELTSLPTYIMVAMSRMRRMGQEAAMKYFFLGAMSTAVLLYGFALLYGSAGTIILTEMVDVFAAQAADGGINTLGLVGMILVVLGLAFKLAAAPMHFYAADVYEGAASPVTAFLAFAPKAAGVLSLILVLATMGWSGHYDYDQPGLPQPVLIVLWMVAVLTMTLGNIGALLQRSAKRVLAYSSIAHSGYLLIGVIAGPEFFGVQAVLFYLLAYGVMNTAAFGVLAALERRGTEIESMDDLVGLRHRHPAMAVVMAVAALSLIGLPPLLGFWGKLYLFIAGIEAGHVPLIIIAAINSAISAWYYLKLAGLPTLFDPTPQTETIENRPTIWPRVSAVALAVLIVVLPLPYLIGQIESLIARSAEIEVVERDASGHHGDAAARDKLARRD